MEKVFWTISKVIGVCAVIAFVVLWGIFVVESVKIQTARTEDAKTNTQASCIAAGGTVEANPGFLSDIRYLCREPSGELRLIAGN